MKARIKLKKLNWTNYFIELIIVFLGITIAFYINKRAETKKTKQQEQNYIQMIKADLINTAKEDSTIVVLLNKELKDFIALRDLVKSNDKTKLDSLLQLYNDVGKVSKYHPNIMTYELLVENGEVLKLSNFELRKRLSEYYAYRDNLKTKYSEVNKLKINQLNLYLDKNYDFFNKKALNPSAFFTVELLNILYRLRQVLLNRIVGFRKAIDMNNAIQSTIR